nr:hypothetical protein [Tanacetum cinerariifolium]
MSKRARSTWGKPTHRAKKQWKKRYEPLHKGVTFRLGGMEREMSFLKFRWTDFVTSIARSFGLLTNEMVSVLNHEPPLHVYRKTLFVKMGVIMKLYEGECCWLATKEVVEENEGDDEECNGEGVKKGVGGSADIYHNISQGDWQVCQAR